MEGRRAALGSLLLLSILTKLGKSMAGGKAVKWRLRVGKDYGYKPGAGSVLADLGSMSRRLPLIDW